MAIRDLFFRNGFAHRLKDGMAESICLFCLRNGGFFDE
jgi:hypothetical protein